MSPAAEGSPVDRSVREQQGMTMEERARDFATRYHASIDHRRKYTGEPYITHPAAVVELVRSVPHTEAMICAAWLHDTVEDTPCALDEIERVFGFEVAALVEMLTDVSKPSNGKRAVRKAIDSEHTAKASPAAKTIKLADLIDNTTSIVERDPSFAKVYLAEKAMLLEVLRDGDATLWEMAHGMLSSNG
jgi:(p)ppGpp synthase/HD superfamily hydrolase